MTYTEYAILDDEELLAFTLTQTNASNLEIELAQRVGVLLDLVAGLQDQLLVTAGMQTVEESLTSNNAVDLVGSRLQGPYEQDTRRKSKRLC